MTTPSGNRPWLVLGAMTLPLLALSMDMNGIGTVLPSIHDDLDVSDAAITWVVSAMAVTFAATLIPVGRLAPRLGNRRLILIGVALFGLASLGCALSPTFPLLVVGRVVQGLGGVLTFTTSLAVIAAVFDDRRRAAAIGAWGVVNGVGGALGPLVGGALTSAFSWRAFFLLNVPLCAAALPVIARLAPADQLEHDTTPLPWFRLGALATALVALTIGFQSSASAGWRSVSCAVPLAVGVAIVAALLLTRSRTSREVLSAMVTRAPFFRTASLVAFCSNWGFGVIIVFVADYLQSTLGLTPVASGLVFTVFSGALALAGVAIGRLATSLGLWRSLLLAMALASASTALGAGLTSSTAVGAVAAGLVLAGFAQGLAFNLSTLAALAGVPPDGAAEASAFVSVIRSMGLTVGVAVSTTLALSHENGIGAVMVLATVVGLIGIVGTVLDRSARTTRADRPSATTAASTAP